MLAEGAKAAGPYASPAEAKAAGAVTLNYGVFINSIVSFIIVAFAIFMIVKAANSLKQQQAEAPAAPPAPTKDQVLLSGDKRPAEEPVKRGGQREAGRAGGALTRLPACSAHLPLTHGKAYTYSAL